MEAVQNNLKLYGGVGRVQYKIMLMIENRNLSIIGAKMLTYNISQ